MKKICLFLALCLCLILFGCSARKDEVFSFVVVPDTQTLMNSKSEKLKTLTEWIMNNRETYNIKFVLHVGDMFDNGSNLVEQNKYARECFDNIISSDLPIMFAMGNHDYDNNINSNRNSSTFNSLFKVSDFEDRDWFIGTFEEGKIENSYSILQIGKQKYLIICLEFGPRDAVIDWAEDIIVANPDCKVIINTHSYLYIDGTHTKPGDKHNPVSYGGAKDGNDGQSLFERLIKKHKNIYAVFSGHHILDTGVSYRTDTGDNQNIIFQSFQNWQGSYNGYIRVVTVDNKNNIIDIKVYDTENDIEVIYDGYNDTIEMDSDAGNILFSGVKK